MAETLITITGAFRDDSLASGTYPTGTITFRCKYERTDTDTNRLYAPFSIVGHVTSSGGLGIGEMGAALQLPATDDVTITPKNWQYEVIEALTGKSERRYLISVPRAGGAIDLSDVQPSVDV